MDGKKLMAVAASAVMIASATPLAAYATEGDGTGASTIAAQSATRADVTVRDATIKASSLRTNLYQMKSQIKDLMLVSPTSGTVYENLEVQLPSNWGDLAARKLGSYTINFIYAPDVVGTATLTLVSDEEPATAPFFSAADAAAVSGAALVTVYGGGQTNEAHNLVASSLAVSGVSATPDGTYVATATINSALVEQDYRSALAPVNQGKFVYDAQRSNLTATFSYDQAAKAWKVTEPARIAFVQAPKASGEFSFEQELTVAPDTVRGMSTRQLIAYLKEQLVKTAKVGGQDVADSDGFSVALGNQLGDIVAGKEGSYRIEFMYDGDGYNNEVVGSSTLVIADEKDPGETNPSSPADPKGDAGDAGGANASDGTPEIGKPDTEKTAGNDAAESAESKQAKKTQQRSTLPQTGDAAGALPALAAAAGSVLAGISRRLRRH